MPPTHLAPSAKPVVGRYLTFSEREDIDLPPFRTPVVGSMSQEVSDGEGEAAVLYRRLQTANG